MLVVQPPRLGGGRGTVTAQRARKNRLLDSAPSPVCPDSRGDPVLEISVVYGQTQVGVKVVGPLDLETTASFLSVMGDLLLEGFVTTPWTCARPRSTPRALPR